MASITAGIVVSICFPPQLYQNHPQRLNAICNATTGRQGSRNAKTTASSCVGQSPNPPHYRSRKAHLQHPQEDSCNQGCDDNQDYPRTRICDQLTRPRQRRPRARRLARGRLEVVLVLYMLLSSIAITTSKEYRRSRNNRNHLKLAAFESVPCSTSPT